TLLIGLSLIPASIPLVWLLLPLLTGEEPLFTIMVPLAIAMGAVGLGLGVVVAVDWSIATRMKILLALLVLAYLTAGGFALIRKDLVEQVRKKMGRENRQWRESIPEDKAYTAYWPVRPAKSQKPAIAGWNLTTYIGQDPRRASDQYLIAHGATPAEILKLPENEWFDAVRKLLVKECGAVEASERGVTHQGYAGRELSLVLPDRLTSRIVRLYRVQGNVFLQSVEGPGLPGDSADVRQFFDRFRIRPAPGKP
ncbi:MAG: hypothetical protein ACRCZF_04740, partial [Gemmataceae bacterium]